jgi:hypothetical protein
VWEIEAMHKFLIAAVFAGAVLLDARPAPAYTNVVSQAPWCAVLNMGTGDAYWDCHYSSIAECRPAVLAGNRGWCNPNPYWVGWNGPADGPPRRHIRRYDRY